MDIINKNIVQGAIPFDKLDDCLRITLEIIENLDDSGLSQLLGGSEGDVDRLLQDLVTETYSTVYGNFKHSNSELSYNPITNLYLDKLTDSFEETLRVESLTYFISSVMPEFEMNWHHIEWAETCQAFKYMCILAARDHGKSHFFSNAYPIWKLYRYTKDSKRRELSTVGKEGYLFSFAKGQSTKLLRTLKTTIQENELLREKLLPETRSDGNWAETRIVCKNGSTITSSSAGASTRGAHPHFIIVDDFLHESNLYSAEQRNKYTSYFYSVIMNMIVPQGDVKVVGTPFHAEDLYGQLKKDKIFYYAEYPSIFPDGKLLWRNRYNFDTLYNKKESQGSVTFSREHLVRPVSNDSSLFPYNILQKSLVGMDKFEMCHNIESFPISFERVVIGVDLAISANVGADYTVYTVLGLDASGDIWLINQYRMHGKSYLEQLGKLRGLNVDFKPDIIVIESNGFQAMFCQAADSEGLPIVHEATSAKSKNDLKTGIPGMSLLFEKGKIKVPIGSEYSRNIKDILFNELTSVSYTNKGISATSGHDDTAMSMHQAIKGIYLMNSGFGVEMI
jgi:hypothetical protein